jgi:DNA-binding response OmpR family regulator
VSRVLIVEDNADLSLGLRNNLEIDGYDVEVAGDGTTGLTLARTKKPDLVILDLMLPGTDGFRVLRTLRTEGFTMPILILTARGEEADKVRGLRLGADDYVTKPFGLLELLARVEVLLRRTTRRQIESFGEIELDPALRTVTLRGQRVDLAPKEFDLLVALLGRDGSVVSRLALLREVWGYSDDVVSRTVDTHIAELRRKLEDDASTPRHILTVRKAGYRIQR